MHIHQAVNYVIVSYVIEHGCRLMMESDSDTDIFCHLLLLEVQLEVRSLDVYKLLDAC